MNFAEYITPEEAHKLMPEVPLKEWRRRARSKAKCEVCGQPTWKYADTGLCFTCTTGEADASEDYELI
jgi:ribosomal protein S14